MSYKICIHGHFYQPPRENPWLDFVEKEESAHPYHDWNERVTAECYAPNTFSRILKSDKTIIKIINNFARISFNIGPTLFRWLEEKSPETYRGILEADKESLKFFHGHGSAIAQAYNHMIMPLATLKDKRTQVKWGIADFEHRFKRKPEGMWLPETAVNTETLEVLAEHGIAFTILAPHQALRVRPFEDIEWQNLKVHGVDTARVYLCRLPSGRSIHLFFYNGGISHGVGFGSLLNDGLTFFDRLAQTGREAGDGKLVNIAVDGETFGHHHRFGDMALAFCNHTIIESPETEHTVYGLYLEEYPPQFEVEINENTSWSCSHGVERWRAHCGCATGNNPNWNQYWRAPLRENLNWLQSEINKEFAKKSASLFKDTENARDDYVSLILDRSEENIKSFMQKHCYDHPDDESITLALKFMELQKFLMFMYTSCGWFFDDITGIESLQILQYALRAAEIGEEVLGKRFVDSFLKLTGAIVPNNEKITSKGRIVKQIELQRVDDLKAGVYFAVSLLYSSSVDEIETFRYRLQKIKYDQTKLGKCDLLRGSVQTTNTVIRQKRNTYFVALQESNYDVKAYAQQDLSKEKWDNFIYRLDFFIQEQDEEGAKRFLRNHLGSPHTLQHLLKDLQTEISKKKLSTALEEMEETQNELFIRNRRLFAYFLQNRIPVPMQVQSIVDGVLSRDIIGQFKIDPINVGALRKSLRRGRTYGVNLYKEEIGLTASQSLTRLILQLTQEPENFDLLEEIKNVLKIIYESGMELEIWQIQNTFFTVYSELRKETNAHRNSQTSWNETLIEIGHYLNMDMESP